MTRETDLLSGIEAAAAGRWDEAHKVAQRYADPIGNWLHAVVHKIEGDEWNSRYWYARTAGHQYTDCEDPRAELLLIKKELLE